MNREKTGNAVIDTVDSALESGFSAVDSVLESIFNIGHSKPEPEPEPKNDNDTTVVCHCHEVTKK